MKRKNLRVRFAAMSAMVFAMFALALGLAACSGDNGPSAEALIKDDLTTNFNEVNADSDDFVESIEDVSGDELEQLGVDSTEFTKAFLHGFDYKIGKIVVDEDKGVATAKVTIICKSMQDIVEATSEAATAEADSLQSLSEEEVYKRVGAMMLEAAQNAEVKSTKCTFTYRCNSDDEWEAGDDAEEQIYKAMGAQE